MTAHPGGLAIERTALSWRRTTLSVCVLAVVGIRHGAHATGPGVLLVGAAAAGLGVALWLSTYRRRLHGLPDRRPDGRAPAALALLVVAIGLITAGSVL